MRRPNRRAKCTWMAALPAVLLLASASAAADRRSEIEQRLAELTRRWAGARCVLRVPIEIKKRPEGDGGFHSPLMTVPQLQRRFSNGASRLWVSDRAALSGILVDGTVPAGTELVAEGWRLLYPEDNDGAYLALRFAAAPVEARFFFISGMKTIGVGPGIDKVEEFLRFDLLEVHSASDRLEAPPPPASARAVAEESDAVPTLRLLGAGVEPTRVRRGERLDVTLSYELTGSACQVGERREIVRDAEVLKRFDDGFARSTGVHSSTKPVVVPVGAPPGLYKIRVEINCGASRAESAALFEVE